MKISVFESLGGRGSFDNALPIIRMTKQPHGGTYLVVADFYVLLHHDPCDRLSQGGRGEGAVVRPVIISVGG